MTFVLPFYADLCVGERSITGCECTGDIDLNSIIVPQEEHQMRSFSRSTSLRVEEIEQLWRPMRKECLRRPMVQSSSCFVSRGVGAQIDHRLDLVACADDFGAITSSLHSVHVIPYGDQTTIPAVAMTTSFIICVLIAWGVKAL